jgi:hypothetical protein
LTAIAQNHYAAAHLDSAHYFKLLNAMRVSSLFNIHAAIVLLAKGQWTVIEQLISSIAHPSQDH